jgi:hypothetical protein
MGDLIQFPERKPPVFTPPPRGYCCSCGVECDWPSSTAWPDTCPNGCTPFAVTSWPPSRDVTRVVDHTGTVLFTLDT